MKTYKLENGVQIFSYGCPVKTESALDLPRKPVMLEEPYFIEFTEDRSLIRFQLTQTDRVYGLGGNLGGINKRGRVYQSYCTDDASHTEDKTTLYGAHNFFMVIGERATGYFIDFPARIKYDVGFTDNNLFEIEIHGLDFEVCVIDADRPQTVISKFHETIGMPYVPPKWGFGYFQSRWGYKDIGDVSKIYQTFKDHEMPLDGIYLDLDYMDGFKDFTVSSERFGELKSFAGALKEEGVHLIPIIDAGVKIEKGYKVYEEGIQGDHFCKDRNGKPYVAAVWPGRVHFPDFMKTETQDWFGDKYSVLTALGIDGFWNDMNEPAIFYDETALQEAVDLAVGLRHENLDAFSYFELKDKFENLLNKASYYQSFFHDYLGKQFSNEALHNLYGFFMTKSANTGLTKLLGDKRFVLISRASCIGMHRYGGIWTGDNASWWSHLEQAIFMLPGLNMCGFYYIGSDTGGFGGSCTGEMLLRWLQLSAFTPLFRNHSAIGNRYQEPFSFEADTAVSSKKILRARYRLIPYLYSEYMNSVNNRTLFFSPLSFEFDNEMSRETEDQIFVGSACMIAPVYKANKKGRPVYLPQDMLEVDLTQDTFEGKIKRQGIHYLDYALDELKCWVRKDAMLPYVPTARNVKHLDLSHLNVIAYVDKSAEYLLYDDDGTSYDYKVGHSTITKINIEKTEGDYLVKVENTHASIKTVSLKIYNSEGQITEKTMTL